MIKYVSNDCYGIYSSKFYNYVDKKLEKMPYAQAGIIYAKDGTIYLKSYSTIVARLTADGYFYSDYYDFSATTRKHISAFLWQFSRIGYAYQVCKSANGKLQEYNIFNGGSRICDFQELENNMIENNMIENNRVRIQ